MQPFSVSLAIPGRDSLMALTLSPRFLAIVFLLVALGTFLIVGLALAVLAGIGYVLIQIALLALALLTAIATSAQFLALLIPTIYILLCLTLIFWCGRFLLASFFGKGARS